MARRPCRAPMGAMIVVLLAVAAGPSHAAGNEADAVLWSQDDDDSFTGLTSQNFESSFDAYDCQAADDFVVPRGEVWAVRKVRARGFYGGVGGPADSENVVFYRSAGGVPAEEVASFMAVVGVEEGGEGSGMFLVALPETLKLKAGRYWLSVQVNMDYNTNGAWSWEWRTSQNGKPAVWKNPGDGFDTGCTNYRPEAECVDFRGGPDHMFELLGSRKAGR